MSGRAGPTISVLIVGYNHARFLRECLDSVRMQTRGADRILIADDASLDDSHAVVEDYLAEHPDFAEFLPNDTNLGLTPTLNRLLARVDTDLVTYLSADDLMLPTRLEKQTATMQRTGADVSYSDAVVIDAHSRVIHASSQIEFPWPAEPARSESIAACLLDANWIPAASIVLRTASLRRAGGYAESIFFEDFELLVRLSRGGARFASIEEPLVAVRRLDTSLGAVGFGRENPRYLVAMDAALRHYRGADAAIAHRALTVRWEVAKRAGASSLPVRARVSMLTGARKGAGRPGALAFHVGRTVARAVTEGVRKRWR